MVLLNLLKLRHLVFGFIQKFLKLYPDKFYFFGADGGEWVVAHLIIIGSGSNYYNAMLLTATAV